MWTKRGLAVCKLKYTNICYVPLLTNKIIFTQQNTQLLDSTYLASILPDIIKNHKVEM